MPALLLLLGILWPGTAAAQETAAAAMQTGPTDPRAWLAVLPIVLPFLGSALSLAARSRPAWQSRIAFVALALAVLAALALNAAVVADGPMVMAAGNWLAPFAIVVAVDELGALLVLVTTLVGLVGLLYARAEIDSAGTRLGFYTFYLLLIAGVCGAFSTGDIFNLYVWFEVFLVSSFGLIVHGGRPVQLDGAVKYGVLNLIGTTVFLIAVGALYGITGTLNMADIRGVLATIDGAPLATLGALFVLAFAMKAAAFPLHMWLPASYHTPTVIVSALFAGLLTKVGVYSLLRVMVMLFAERGAPFLTMIGWVGVATAILGAMGALAQNDLRRMAAFLVVSGIGVMLIGVGLGSAAGLSGAIVYAVHSILVMTALFLALGLAERGGGMRLSSGANLCGLHALTAGLFLVFALSAAGLPPFSGFWPKLMLVEASIASGGPLAVAGALGVILSGFLTTVVTGRAWALVFLRPAEPAAAPASGRGTMPRPAPLAVLIMAGFVIGLGLFPAVVVGPAQQAAATLLDPSTYLDRVLGSPVP